MVGLIAAVQGVATVRATPSVAESAANLKPSEGQAFLDANCKACHSARTKAGGVVLENTALSPLGPNADLWERVVVRMKSGEMPPPTVKNRPDAHQSAAFVAWLVGSLDQYAAKNPDPGLPVIRRLTREEYSNAVRDLLAVDVDPGADFPAETIVNSLNNNGDALSISPLLMEKYMSAARRVTRLAIGDQTIQSASTVYRAPDYQADWAEGVPFGARRTVSIKPYFAVAGEYELRLIFGGDDLGFAGLPPKEGQHLFRFRLNLPAGAHSIALATPESSAVPEGALYNLSGPAGTVGGPIDPLHTATPQPVFDLLVDGKRVESVKLPPVEAIELRTPAVLVPGAPFVRSVEIEGPMKVAGSGDTESRRLLFTCQPSKPADEAACAQKILTRFTRRAFRRDVAARDVGPFMAIYQKSRTTLDFEHSIQQAVQAVLVSPAFLYRVETEPADSADRTYKVNDFELASRLSFFIWSSIPDDRLLKLAGQGRLSQPKVLEAETRRMLSDPKSEALAANFGMQYLGLQALPSTMPDRRRYPFFSTSLRNDFGQESRLFLREVFAENRTVLDIVGGNFTYLNENLARHYNVAGVKGGQFRRVAFKPTDVRGGVLGQGSIALVTSHTAATSPVLRGKWVLSNLLGTPPGNPPPGIPQIEPADASGRPLTGRQQMEMHRKSPCASCHSRMDPFGFSMENLDVVGAWRDQDDAGPVNAAVTLVGGEAFTGIPGLRQRLLNHREDFAQAFTVSLYSYALGRKVQGADMPQIRKMVRQTEASDYKFHDVVLQVVKSPGFQLRRKVKAS